MKTHRVVVAAASMALLVVACGDDGAGGDLPSASADDTVAVLTSEPLADVVTALADGFADDHPDVTVELDVVDADDVDEDIRGRAVDVLIMHDGLVNGLLDEFESASESLTIKSFGSNPIVVVTPPGNPAGVSGPDVFATGGERVRVCAPDSPYGNLGSLFLTNIGVTPASGIVGVDCEAEAVAAAAAGQLDAVLVFRSRVGAPGDVEIMEIPEANAVELSYAVFNDTPEAQSFTEFLESETGVAIRTEHGYLP